MALSPISSFILLALGSLVHAQTQFATPIPCCSVTADTIPLKQRTDWCSANLNTCVDLCGGKGQIASIHNTCDVTTLQYACRCSSGTTPDLKEYEQTVPGSMCRYWYSQCISAASGNAVQQLQCDLARNVNCGNKTAGDSSTASTGSQSISTPISPPSSSRSAAPSPSPSDAPVSKKSGVSSGVIAGAVIGSMGGLIVVVVLVWICRRRRKGTKVHDADARSLHYDDKQVADPTSTVFSMKPELHGDAMVPELHSIIQHHHAELHTLQHQSAELQGNDYDNTAEFHSSTPRPETNATTSPYALAPIPSYHHEPPAQAYERPEQPQHSQQSPNEVPEIHSGSPVPSRSVAQRQLSSDEIAALEEEERRVDAEMEEVRRMKELRDQKFAIQQRLREAKGG